MTSADPKETFLLHSENSDRIKIMEHKHKYFCDSRVAQSSGLDHWPALIFPKLQIPSPS